MRSRFSCCLYCYFCYFAQLERGKRFIVSICAAHPEILRDHLDLGGTNPRGGKITFNSFYMEENGTPRLPVMGEFHYARFPEAYWDESLRKMKAGGVNVVATYVFWNMHEEVEGEFDWSGPRNLRHFIELCGKNDLQAIVRVGPFCHGEIRNGGLPDWLYGRPFNVRSNDPTYLHYVQRLYGEIAKQLDGLLYKNGGPVIGIQLENEYQHSGAPGLSRIRARNLSGPSPMKSVISRPTITTASRKTPMPKRDASTWRSSSNSPWKPDLSCRCTP